MSDCRSCESAPPVNPRAHCPGHKDESCIVEETIATVLTTLELDAVLERTAELLRRHFGRTRITIIRVLEDSPDEAEVLLADDPSCPTPAPGTRFRLEGTASGLAVRSGTRQLFDNLDPDHPRVAEEQQLGQYGYGAVVCLPLLAEQRVLGTLEIAHPPRCGLLSHCVMVAERVAQLIAIALRNSSLMLEVKRLNHLLEHENTYLKDQIARAKGAYVAESAEMQEVLDKTRLVAQSDSSVLIRGETGTGKEGLARLVHEMSPRGDGPFVVVNLGAIPETLIESELFGHEKGAFTGAGRRKLGRFELASGGTIFLDEVGDAPLAVQVKLLRVLQEQTIERVGAERSTPVDVRVVAATNRPLERLIEEGSFRSDFYYRLSTFPVHLPPLRERREDLRPLAEQLLAKHAGRMHRRPPEIPAAAWQRLAAHDWPGNIRELENYLERALILSPGATLELPSLGPGTRALPAVAPAAAQAALLPFDEAIRRVLTRALEATGGKIYGDDGAAALLGLKPTTLQGKLRKHGIK